MSELLGRFFSKDVRVNQTLLKQSQKTPIQYLNNQDIAEPYVGDLLSALAPNLTN